MHLIGGTIPQGLMQALPIIKLEVTPNPLLCLCNTLIIMQVNFLILHRVPEPFDKYIIQRSPTPIHADTDLSAPYYGFCVALFSPLLISLFFTQLTTLSDCPKNRGTI